MKYFNCRRKQRCKTTTCTVGILVLTVSVVVVLDHILCIPLDSTSKWRDDFDSHYNKNKFISLSDYLRECGIQQPYNQLFVPSVDIQMYTNTPLSSTPVSTNKKFFEKNLKRVLEYKFPIYHLQQYLQVLQFDCESLKEGAIYGLSNEKDPHVVTAASHNHFNELISMLHHFKDLSKRNLPVLKITVYDIGMSNLQLLWLKWQHPYIHMKTFPFDDFPNHVKFLNGYTWKPIIIQLELKSSDFVMWADTSIRVKDDVSLHDIDTFFDKTNKVGVRFFPGYSVAFRNHTAMEMFDFFNEDPRDFISNGIQATFSIHRKNDFTQKGIMMPWVFCALTDGCMVSKLTGNRHTLICTNTHGISYHGVRVGSCHRYDQSALSLISSRLFPHPMCDDIISGPTSDVFRILR